MKKTILALAFALLSAIAFAQERTAIAVFPFEDMDNLLTRNESVLFYQRFSNEFANKNNSKFRIVPRQDVDRLINTEYNFQLKTHFSAQTKTAEMERVLNGAQILSGRIVKFNNKIAVSISLYTYPELEHLSGVDIDVNNKDELFTKIPDFVQRMMTAIAGGSTAATPPANTQKTYKIGDTGPAGGIVFYDKGTFSGGWQYLEAAPAETEVPAEWGMYTRDSKGNHYQGIDVSGTSTTVGSGKRNTQLIVEQLNQRGERNRAAQICASLNFDGYKDWFLPSIAELNLMFINLKQNSLGGFNNGWYWSSSQSSSNTAWQKGFGNGEQENRWGNFNKFSVRAIRAF